MLIRQRDARFLGASSLQLAWRCDISNNGLLTGVDVKPTIRYDYSVLTNCVDNVCPRLLQLGFDFHEA